MPHDFPNPVFYTSVKDGGLGIPCMRYSIPLMARSRLRDNSARTTQLCNIDGKIIKNKKEFLRIMKNKLYQSVDGSGLRQAARVPSAHYWVSDGISFLSGKDFISSIHLRFNCLSTQARLARGAGRMRQKSCRRCGDPAKTLNHIVQNCHVSDYHRIKRHNAVVHYIARSLNQRGLTTHLEKSYVTPNGTLKPDITAYDSRKTVVVDVQVINDQFDLETAHENKKNKYLPLAENLKDLRNEDVKITPFTLPDLVQT